MKSVYVNTKLGGRNTVYVKGKAYQWISVYKTYNSIDTNELLRWADLDIDKPNNPDPQGQE